MVTRLIVVIISYCVKILNHYVVLYSDYMGKKKKGTLEKQKNIQFGFKWIGAHYKCVFVFIYTQLRHLWEQRWTF